MAFSTSRVRPPGTVPPWPQPQVL